MSWGQSGRHLESEFDRIAHGGLASSTQRRLGELTGWGGFSSFLSAPEFSVGESIGVHPVAQLVGLAAGEIWAGYIRVADRWRRSLKVPGVVADEPGLVDGRWQEHPQMVRGLNELRHRALRRLTAQAKQLGCQAVVGVVPTRAVEEDHEGRLQLSTGT